MDTDADGESHDNNTEAEQNENLSLNIKNEILSPENVDDPEELEDVSNNETNLEPVEKVICIKKEVLYEERNEDPLNEGPISLCENVYIKEEPIIEKCLNSGVSTLCDPSDEESESGEELLPSELCKVQTRICKCSHQCTKLTPDAKEKIFESFCKLSENDKSAFLARCMELKEPLRRTVKHGTSRRQFTFSYSVQLAETSQRIKICLKTLCELTGCTPRRIQVLQKKVKLGVTDFSDLRGRHYNRPNRIADEIRDLVRKHIKMCLSRLTNGSLVPRTFSVTTQSLNIKEMYELFKAEYPDLRVSETVYRRTYHKEFKL